MPNNWSRKGPPRLGSIQLSGIDGTALYRVARKVFSFLFDMLLICSVLLMTLATILFVTLMTPLVMLFSMLLNKSPRNNGWKEAEAS